MSRKIDQLKEILDSQIPGWDKIETEIKQGQDGGLVLDVPEYYVMFCFDSTGEKFIGIINWKE